jgi:hypothetical protein
MFYAVKIVRTLRRRPTRPRLIPSPGAAAPAKLRMREMALSKLDSFEATEQAASEPALMDEESFASFYRRTARPLWGYLARLTRGALDLRALLHPTAVSLARFLLAGPSPVWLLSTAVTAAMILRCLGVYFLTGAED